MHQLRRCSYGINEKRRVLQQKLSFFLSILTQWMGTNVLNSGKVRVCKSVYGLLDEAEQNAAAAGQSGVEKDGRKNNAG